MFTREQFTSLRKIDQIDSLSWKDFEYFSKFLLESRGHQSVFVTKKHGKLGGDRGVDLVSNLNGQDVLSQCKKWSESFRGTFKGFIPVRVVRELGGCMLRESVHRGAIITTLEFEYLDKMEAEKMNIELIGRQEIVQSMIKVNPEFNKKSKFTLWSMTKFILLNILRVFVEY